MAGIVTPDMSIIEFHSAQSLRPTVSLRVAEPMFIAQSLMDIYLPSELQINLKKIPLVSPADHGSLCWKFKIKWADCTDENNVIVFFSVKKDEQGNTDAINFNINFSHGKYDRGSVIRDIEFNHDNDLVRFSRELTLIPEGQRGHGYGTRLLQGEIQWVRVYSKNLDSSITGFSMRMPSVDKPPGQFAWRKSFDFKNESSKCNIQRHYHRWLTENMPVWEDATKLSEASLREALPKTIEHPWTLDGCVLPCPFDQYVSTLAQGEGYPGRDIFAWAFWNADARNATSAEYLDLTWYGIRYVNQPWHGPL